jgi:hypothetical protein
LNLHGPTHHKQNAGVAVIGATISIFPSGSAKLRHGQYNNILHAVTQILVESRQGPAKLGQEICKLAPHAAFIHVMIPPAIHPQGVNSRP